VKGRYRIAAGDSSRVPACTGALEGELSSLITVRMGSKRSAALAGMRPVPARLQQHEASQASLPGMGRGRFTLGGCALTVNVRNCKLPTDAHCQTGAVAANVALRESDESKGLLCQQTGNSRARVSP
jgi:hypothetical protein